jgi:hypothetical protein
MGKPDVRVYHVPVLQRSSVEAVNILTTGIIEMQGAYYGAFIILDGSESFLMYRYSLTGVIALEMAAHPLIADMQPCDKAGCKTCTFVCDIKAEPELKTS